MENMKINQLPSKTWNWLKMNETAVSGISVSGAHEGNLEIPEGIAKTVCPAGLPDRFKDVAGGMGSDMDMLIRESAAGAVLLSADSDVYGEPARIRFAYGAFEHSLNTFGILATRGFMGDMLEKTGLVFDTAHNEYIQYLLTIGPIALLGYLVFLVGSCRTMVKAYRKNPYILACMTGVLCYGVQAIVNLNLPIVTPMLWFWLSVGIGLVRRNREC